MVKRAYKIEIRWYGITTGCITPYKVKYTDVVMSSDEAQEFRRTMQPMLRASYSVEITVINL